MHFCQLSTYLSKATANSFIEMLLKRPSKVVLTPLGSVELGPSKVVLLLWEVAEAARGEVWLIMRMVNPFDLVLEIKVTGHSSCVSEHVVMV